MKTRTRQSVQIKRFGDASVLRCIEHPIDPLLPGTVRIEVKATGVNFADLMMRMGLYPEAPKPPFVPGYEIAGVVAEVHPTVNALQKGDRVLAGCRFGGYTSDCVLPARQVRKIPDHLSFEHAAAIPVNFMTAWVALHEMARVRPGDRVLIPSAAGGVGIAALQMAKRAGAYCVALIGSPHKRDFVRVLGADEILLQGEWDQAPDSSFAPFDVVLDSTGGASLKRGYRRLARAGRVVNYGVSSFVSAEKRSLWALLKGVSQTPFFTPLQLMMKNRGVFGLNMLQLFDPLAEHLASPAQHQPDPMLRAMDAIMEIEGSPKPFQIHIGGKFTFSEAAQAHRHLQDRYQIGKVILTPS